MTELLVIGGGICGLYQAYNHVKKYPHDKVIVVEKAPIVGGRARQFMFAGALVPGGAGVGRLPKDRKLAKLIRDFGYHLQTFKTSIEYRNIKPINVNDTLQYLINTEHKQPCFSEFAKHALGAEKYQQFIDTVGYTDFIHSNTHDVLYNYGFDDTISGQTKFYVPWNEMIDKMMKHIDVRVSSYVIDIDTASKTVTLNDNSRITYKNIVVAIPPRALLASPLTSLFSKKEMHYIQNIKGQPFCYVYAQLVEPIPIYTYTVVPQPLQKVVPMESSQNIYMIGYADNHNAIWIKKHIKTRENLEDTIFKVLGFKTKVKHFKVVFWKDGTHYRSPGTSYMHIPILKGEAYAKNQGWTNGGF